MYRPLCVRLVSNGMESNILILVLIGLAAGLGSGVFGIGGGVVIVPALVFLAGFSQHRATGTSLAVLLPPVGLAAVFEFARHGQVDFKAAIAIALAMFLGAYGGAFIANKTGDGQLKALFGVFLLGLSLYTLWGAWKSHLQPVAAVAAVREARTQT